MLFAMATAVLAEGNVKVVLNNEEIHFDAEPFIEDGRTLVPIRAITEAMGCDVDWNSASSTALIKNAESSVSIQIGGTTIKVTDNLSEEITYVTLDVPAKIYEDRTYVPLRAVSEAFGADVDWNGDARLITITYSSVKNESVSFNDEAFEYSVRRRLGEEERIYHGEITDDILANIDALTLKNSADGTELRSIEDIKKFPNLRTLYIDEEVENIDDLSLLCDENSAFSDPAFEICVRMNIADNYDSYCNGRIYIGTITDDMLQNVTSITSSELPAGMQLSSLEDLKLVPNVNELDIESNQTIEDFSPIGDRKEWKCLCLSCANIEDDSFLDDITVTDMVRFPNVGYSIYTVDFTNTGSKYQYPQALSMYKQTLREMEKLKEKIDDSMSDYEKFKTIHDFVSLNMEYDWKQYEADIYGYDYEWKYYPDVLSQFFIGGTGVCEDYSEIYSKLCDYFGLECWLIRGEVDGAYGWDGHAWNIVKLDGNYYHVDVTWDDLDDGENDVYYECFLVSDDEIKETHSWDYEDGYLSRFTAYGFEDMDYIPECPNNYIK